MAYRLIHLRAHFREMPMALAILGLRTAGAVPLDDEQSAADGGACIAVGHENLRVDVGLKGDFSYGPSIAE